MIVTAQEFSTVFIAVLYNMKTKDKTQLNYLQRI